MPGCVLRASSSDFQVDEFLRITTFVPCHVYRKGEVKGQGNNIYPQSRITIVVSEADGDKLTQQIQDAIEFLELNKAEIQQLKDCVGAEGITLDFGIWSKDVFGQFCYLPPRLLQLAGELGVGVELSLYPIPQQLVSANQSA